MASEIDIADTAVPYNSQYDPRIQLQNVILLRVPHIVVFVPGKKKKTNKKNKKKKTKKKKELLLFCKRLHL